LVVSNASGLRGDTDGDGDVDRILSYGARSFSIHDANGTRVFDSADMIEKIVATQFPSNFFDGRSDNKGPEPEGVTVAVIGGRTYAFVGLERSHMVLIFDVTNPAAVSYAGAAKRDGDLNPEGLVVVPAVESPTGRALLLVTSEDSNTLSVFEIGQPAANFTLQLLHLSDGEAGLLASQTAPNLAALVDAFDDRYENTLIVSGGDNFIPSPFLNAGTAAVIDADTGHAHFQRKIHHLADLLSEHLAERTAENGEILRKKADRTAVDRAVAGNHPVTKRFALRHAEIHGSVDGKCIEFNK
jgi:hypothetical protein